MSRTEDDAYRINGCRATQKNSDTLRLMGTKIKCTFLCCNKCTEINLRHSNEQSIFNIKRIM